MDENKNIPIARTGGGSRASKPQTPAPAPAPNEGDIDLFRAAYKEQKRLNEAEKQAVSEREPKTEASIPVLTKTSVEKKEKEESENRKFKILSIILIIITVVLFLASCIYLVSGMFRKEEPVGTVIKEKPVNTVSAQLSSPFGYQQTYDVEFPEGIQERFKDLYAQNQQFVGWLSVPGTNIDTPVYQSKTSQDGYYLKHDNYGKYTRYGVPYLEELCKIKTLSRNSTIYGHNFDDQMIFDQLHNYEDVEFFKENPIIKFDTIYENYTWKIIAAFRSNGSSSGDNGYLFYYIEPEMGNNSFMEFYDELQQRSYIHTGVDVQPTDKIITLSTCTYFFDRNGSTQNARFAVVARLVREGESESVDTSLAVKNENVRYPQLYYNVFGGTNPYRNASKWTARGD